MIAESKPLDFCQPGLDAVFFAGERLGIAPPGWYDAARMETHLAHSLLRDPRDLATHLRRINFWLGRGDPAALVAALADLFLVLGDSRPELRDRLIEFAGDQIPEHCREFLKAPRGNPPCALPNSLFRYGPAFPGGPDFVGRVGHPNLSSGTWLDSVVGATGTV